MCVVWQVSVWLPAFGSVFCTALGVGVHFKCPLRKDPPCFGPALEHANPCNGFSACDFRMCDKVDVLSRIPLNPMRIRVAKLYHGHSAEVVLISLIQRIPGMNPGIAQNSTSSMGQAGDIISGTPFKNKVVVDLWFPCKPAPTRLRSCKRKPLKRVLIHLRWSSKKKKKKNGLTPVGRLETSLSDVWVVRCSGSNAFGPPRASRPGRPGGLRGAQLRLDGGAVRAR